MSQIVKFEEPVERGSLEVLLSSVEEREIQYDSVLRREIAGDVMSAAREYAAFAVLLLLLCVSADRVVSHDNEKALKTDQQPDRVLPYKTLRNLFGAAGGLGLLVSGSLASIGIYNRRQIKKNEDLLKPLRIT